MSDVTRILSAVEEGDPCAAERLLPLVYDELRKLAAAKLAGASPIVAVDRDAAKLARALERGADAAVDTSADERVVRTLRTLTNGGADHAFEVVGLPETMLLAWKALRAGGTAVVIGIAAKGAELPLPALELSTDKGIRGSLYGSGDPAADLPELAGLAASGKIDFLNITAMQTGTFPDGVPEHYRIPAEAMVSKQSIGRFPDIAPDLGVDTYNLCGGAITEDFNNDGFIDILHSSYDPAFPLTFYRNRGDGTFENQAERTRLELQEAKLVSTERLQRLATMQEFVDPAADKVVYLPKSDSSYALNQRR